MESITCFCVCFSLSGKLRKKNSNLSFVMKVNDRTKLNRTQIEKNYSNFKDFTVVSFSFSSELRSTLSCYANPGKERSWLWSLYSPLIGKTQTCLLQSSTQSFSFASVRQEIECPFCSLYTSLSLSLIRSSPKHSLPKLYHLLISSSRRDKEGGLLILSVIFIYNHMPLMYFTSLEPSLRRFSQSFTSSPHPFLFIYLFFFFLYHLH